MLDQLMNMGFAEADAKHRLIQNKGDFNRALNALVTG
jgi:hypothetical protein